jgi:glucose-1-phosphate adenylyltransferase
MNGTVIGDGCVLDKVICAENSVIGSGTVLGEGEEVPNDTRPDIYCAGLVTVGESTVIPAGVHIGKNVMISGHTTEADYPGGRLASGKTLEAAAQES